MNQITNSLVEETKSLLLSVKRNYLAVAVNVFKLKSEREWSEDEWVAFYRDDLELQKSQVSKFLKVGEFCVAQGFVKTTLPAVGYENLYLSIAHNKDKSPEYVIAEAATWSSSDYRDSKKDECSHEYPKVLVCSHCFKKMD